MVLWLAMILTGGDASVIAQDRDSLSQDALPHVYYLSTANVPADQWPIYDRALRFTCCSLSTQVVVDRCLPVRLSDTLYRIDTRELKWPRFKDVILKHYPYRYDGTLPAVIRADWFIEFFWTDGYYDLAYEVRPKNADDIYAQSGAQRKSILQQSWIEEDSGVALRSRLMRSYPTTQRFELWRTFDSARINAKNDPLNTLLIEPVAFSEWIGPLPKIYQGEVFAMMRFALTGENKKVANFAPANVVVNHRQTRGEGQIDIGLDCLACHGGGLISPTRNGFAEFIGSGAQAYSDKEVQERVETSYLSNLQYTLTYFNDRYKIGITAVCGVEPEQVAKEIIQIVEQYDQAIDLHQVSVELGVTEQHLSRSLGETGEISPRLAQLPRVKIDRESVEGLWQDLLEIVHPAVESRAVTVEPPKPVPIKREPIKYIEPQRTEQPQYRRRWRRR